MSHAVTPSGHASIARPVLCCTGRDVLAVLHRLSTQALLDLPDGGHRTAAFCTPKGRLVDVVQVLRTGDTVCLVGAPGSGPALAEHLDRYVISEDVTVTVEDAGVLAAMGPDAPRMAATVTGQAFRPDAVALDGDLRGWVETAGAASAVCWQGPVEARAARAASLTQAGLAPWDADATEAWRVRAGWPGGGREVSADWNPLEIGYGPAIDFRKGCYIGQEVVARLWYYEKQKQALVRLQLDGDPGGLPAPCATDAAPDAGRVTSAACHEGIWFGLGVLRAAAAAPGTPVRVGNASGTVLARVGADPDAPHAPTS